MAKEIQYKCDICGNPIQTKYRDMAGPSGYFTSSHPSYMKLVFEQMDVSTGYPERKIELDICEECDEAIRELIERRTK